MKSATSSPNARPWTLGKGRPIGTAEVPPIRSAVHGFLWYCMGRHGSQRFFEIKQWILKMTAVHLSQPHHVVADFLPLTSSGILAPWKKETGDPIGSPAPSPVVWRNASRTAFTPYPGSRPRTTRRPHDRRGYAVSVDEQQRNRRSTRLSPGNRTYPDLI